MFLGDILLNSFKFILHRQFCPPLPPTLSPMKRKEALRLKQYRQNKTPNQNKANQKLKLPNYSRTLNLQYIENID